MELERLAEQLSHDARNATERIEDFRLEVIRQDNERETFDPPEWFDEDEVH